MFGNTTPSSASSPSSQQHVSQLEFDPPWLTVRDAAARIGVSCDFIYNACATASLRHIKLGGRRSIRIRPTELDAWMLSFEVVNGKGVN